MPEVFSYGWNTVFEDTDARLSRIANSDDIEVSVTQERDRYGGCTIGFKPTTQGAAGNVNLHADNIHIHFDGPAIAANKTQWPGKVKVIKFKGATENADANLYKYFANNGATQNLSNLARECGVAGFTNLAAALRKLATAWNAYRGVDT